MGTYIKTKLKLRNKVIKTGLKRSRIRLSPLQFAVNFYI